jgi:hypothetical protein
MPEEVLNEPGVQPGVRQHVSRRVPEHVRVNVEPDPSRLSSPLHDARHHVGAERTAALTGEHVSFVSRRVDDLLP